MKKYGWLYSVLLRYSPLYFHVAIASLIVNLFALGMPLFVMNVYDRVIPNKAMETLWTLAIGMGIVIIFDFLLRNARARFVDMAGRNADLLLQSSFMDALLDVRMDANPASSVGRLTALTREFDHLREFIGSTTLISVMDFPFVLIFMGMILMLGGWLVFIPLSALPIMLLFSLVLRIAFENSAKNQLEFSSRKSALMSEIATGYESIRLGRLEKALGYKWDKVVDEYAASNMSARRLATVSANSTLILSAFLNISIIIGGTYRISTGQMSMGALIACVILFGRCMAPIIGLVGLITNLYKMRLAIKHLDTIMQLPKENPEATIIPAMPPHIENNLAMQKTNDDAYTTSENLQNIPDQRNQQTSQIPMGQRNILDKNTSIIDQVHANIAEYSKAYSEHSHNLPPKSKLDMVMENVSFQYTTQSTAYQTLRHINIRIQQGERVAIVGQTGSGKSTLARLLAGLYLPKEGRVLIGSADLSSTPMRPIRRRIGFMPQKIYLFTGTVRENIVMSWPDDYPFSEEALQKIVEIAGVSDFTSQHPLGLNMSVGENGNGLSGGQAQTVAMARALTGNPDILIFDEPTSNLDEISERNICQRLKHFLPQKTFVVLTHRVSMLHLVDRVLVIDHGQIVKDCPVNECLSKGAK